MTSLGTTEMRHGNVRCVGAIRLRLYRPQFGLRSGVVPWQIRGLGEAALMSSVGVNLDESPAPKFQRRKQNAEML
jgi:hypothetical protein